jgi:hypothetical protein
MRDLKDATPRIFIPPVNGTATGPPDRASSTVRILPEWGGSRMGTPTDFRSAEWI